MSFGAHEEYRVLLDGDGETAATPSGRLRAYGELPTVGDWVRVRPCGEFSIIEELEPRKTAFIRKAAGRAHAAQCVAANVDLCFVVCGLDGDFNPRRVERYLVLARESGARPVVVLNKSDVCADVERALADVGSVTGGAPVEVLSALESIDALKVYLQPGMTAVLLGSSGAGKSTIANALSGNSLRTGAVRESDSRGRHTTTAGMLMPAFHGAWLIDTPGTRELGLVAGEATLDSGFPEIASAALLCRFTDCRHEAEPGCAVREALEAGRIPADRWASYVKLRREVRHHAVAADATAQQAEKRKWKAIHKSAKRMYRERERR